MKPKKLPQGTYTYEVETYVRRVSKGRVEGVREVEAHLRPLCHSFACSTSPFFSDSVPGTGLADGSATALIIFFCRSVSEDSCT